MSVEVIERQSVKDTLPCHIVAEPEPPQKYRDELEKLWNGYHEDVYNYALRLTCDPDEAEAVRADTYYNATNYLASGRQINNPHNFLLTTAHHIFVSRYREGRRLAPLEVLDMPENLPKRSNARATVEEQVVKTETETETLESIRKAMQSLSADQQRVILLRFVEELPLKEIAQLMGKEVNNVKIIQHRALAALHNAIADGAPRELRIRLRGPTAQTLALIKLIESSPDLDLLLAQIENPRSRGIIELTLQGKSRNEIAESLHIPIGQVSSCRGRAIRKMSQLLFTPPATPVSP